MVNRYSLALLLAFFTIHFAADAQQKPLHSLLKLGAVTLDELKMNRYEADTSAGAVVLFESGRTRFDTNPSTGLHLVFEKHVIIKILNKSGYDWANVEVPLYRSNNTTKEFISNIKGTTYNLVDGKVSPVKLTKESIFEEKNTENRSTQKFTLPNVKEGTVIEYSYRIQSPFIFTFRDWTFQHTIPTLWSEYKAAIPEYFYYKKVTQGYEDFHINEAKPVNVDLNMPGMNPTGTEYHWVMANVPAIKEEPHMNSIYNYISKIEFELGDVSIPGEFYKSFNNSWDKVCSNLMASEYFGKPISKTNSLKEQVDARVGQLREPKAKMEALYAFVQKEIKYNDQEEVFTDNSFKKVLETKTGNAAEVNLLLVAMLRQAGLEANPVILSTRDNGLVSEITYPNLSKFNYVVGHVKIGEEEFLLDATEPMATVNMLPLRCLNGQGMLVGDQRFSWISLEPKKRSSRTYQCNMVLGADNSLKGKVSRGNTGYAGYSFRKAIQAEGEKKYIEKMRNQSGQWEIDQIQIQHAAAPAEALKMEYDVTVPGQSQPVATIYLNPLQNQGEKENPFKLEERKYPIDFAMPQEETYLFNYTLPEGYKVEEQPKNVVLALPNKAGQFTYSISTLGSTIMVISKVVINQPSFRAADYPFLKEFYNQVVAKHAEQIVLKKIN